MNLQEEIQAAKELCIKAHAGQFRRDGVTPYHTHPFAVADAVPDELKPAALLHDVIEDNPNKGFYRKIWTSFSQRTMEAVVRLTRRSESESYDEYMNRVMISPDAVKIKIADMEHNLSCEPSEHSKQKIARWLPILKAKDKENSK